MRRITAVRHAKSSWSEASLPDLHRPLNQRGKRAVPVMARHLLNRGHIPDLMVSSPAKRAYDTCKGFARIFGFPEEQIVVDDRLYFEGVDAITDMLKELPDTVLNVFFFSHEPIISTFCYEMTQHSAYKFSTSAVCAMEFNIDSWSRLEKGGKTLFFLKPKTLDDSL